MRSRKHIVGLLYGYAIGSVVAHVDSLFTSSVSYCAPPNAIIIQQFDISYFAQNASVVFNVTAASVEPQLTVTANVQLNVYGMKPLNLTFDFCNDLGGTLCPLPLYNFSGAGAIPLPSGVDVGEKLPTIAYKIPDLEAFAQVNLTDVRTGAVKACIQTTLSNGWSTRQPAVGWATQAISALFFVILLFHLALDRKSMMVSRFLDLIYLFQHACSTGMLAIDYPIVYLSYTLNFAWTVALFPNFLPLQHAIDEMRKKTGGHVGPPASPSGTADRRLSPYNAVLKGLGLAPNQPVATGDTTMPATITSPSDALPAGLATYTNSLGISQSNAFMTIFLNVLIVLACLGALLAILGGIVRVLNDRMWRGRSTPPVQAPLLLKAILLLYCLIILPFLPTFIFYQWTIHDSWLTALLSAVGFFVLLIGMIVQAKVWRIHKAVFTSTTLGQIVPFGYRKVIGARKLPHYWPLSLNVLAFLLKSLFVGFGQKSGATQVFGLLVIEILHLVIVTSLPPHLSRHSNAFSYYLAGTRITNYALLIPFVTQLGVKPIPRVVIGIIAAVISSIAMVAVVLDLLIISFTATSVQAFAAEQTSLKSCDDNSELKHENSHSNHSEQ